MTTETPDTLLSVASDEPREPDAVDPVASEDWQGRMRVIEQDYEPLLGVSH